jgi:predicted alternative tryptophan synthase beta-subunit
MFAKSEGIIPAPESCHAIAAAIREAQNCTKTGESKTLLFNLSGHGHFDMSSYDRYLQGDLNDFDYPEEAIKESLAHLPKFG